LKPQRGKDDFGDPGVDGRITLKWILKQQDWSYTSTPQYVFMA
jgi:hypothetical protein